MSADSLSDQGTRRRQVWLCEEHVEDRAVECSCGLTPYIRRDEADTERDRLRAENERLTLEVRRLEAWRTAVAAENEALREVLARIAYPSEFLQSQGALSSLARRELRSVETDDSRRSDA